MKLKKACKILKDNDIKYFNYNEFLNINFNSYKPNVKLAIERVKTLISLGI